MTALAAVGAASARLAPINAFDFVFSQPFSTGSPVLDNAQTDQQRSHAIPEIPGAKPIFVDAVSGLALTRNEAQAEACKIALGLQMLLAKDKGPYRTVSPVVLVHLPNCIHFVPVVMGIFGAGLTATLVNPALTPVELQHIISLARPAAIVTTGDGWALIQRALSVVAGRGEASTLQWTGRVFVHDPLRPIDSPSHLPENTQPLRELYREAPQPFRAAALTARSYQEGTALILWSSGTTGKSKGVRLSHEALVQNTIALWHGSPQLDANERWLGFVPFYHIYGLAVVAMAAPSIGATVSVMARFDSKLMIDLVESERITAIHLAPPVALLLAKSPMVQDRDFSSVKFALSGGAPLGKDVIEMVYERLGFMIFMGFGMSEAGSVTQQWARDWKTLTPRLGSAGEAMHGVELRICSVDDSSCTLNVDEKGEICIRSPAVMLGYLENRAATSEVLSNDGWFRTGDVGKIDRVGALWITDRVKEMIKVKGLQVSPADLEATLCASSHIFDAGVVGIYDDNTASEYPRAYLVPSDPDLLNQCVPRQDGVAPPGISRLAEHVCAWMESRTARYKWLKGNIVFVKQIPKSPSGKILRRLLKDSRGIEVVLYPSNTSRASKL